MVRQATRLLRALGLIERPGRCADRGGKATEHHHLSYCNVSD
jgi:predicted DNA-binding ArsR family transcriptional regulator